MFVAAVVAMLVVVAAARASTSRLRAVPETTIDSGPEGATNQTAATFGFSSDTGLTFECRLDGPGDAIGQYAACTSPQTYAGLVNGARYTFLVRATDAEIQVDPTPAERTFTVDATPPAAPQITQPGGDTAQTATTIRLSGATDPLTDVTVYDHGEPLGQAQIADTGEWSIELTALTEGEHVFTAQAKDRAGNPSALSAPRTVHVDTRPVLTSTSPPPARSNDTTPTPSPRPAPTPTPEFHQTVVVRPISGRLLVRRPGSTEFVALDTRQGIPLGSTIDARKGRIQLVSEPGQGETPQRAVFYAGIFKVTQPGVIIELTLDDELAPCPRSGKASAAATKPKSRKLWGDGKGRFRTRGRYSAATVRGARWLVQDSCAGTLTRAAQGVVAVRDDVKRRTVLLRGGRSYLARPRR